MKKKEILFEFGGPRSPRADPIKSVEIKDRILASYWLSFDLVTIISSSPTSLSTINIELNPKFQNVNFVQSTKGCEAIGIHVTLFSSKLTPFYEGICQWLLIRFFNELTGCEYYSVNFSPHILLDLNFLNFPNWHEFLNAIGEYLQHRFQSSLPEISGLNISFYLGENTIQMKGSTAKQCIIERRQRKINHRTPIKEGTGNVFALPFSQDRAPGAIILISPFSSDPANYICYTDLQEAHLSSEFCKRFGIIKTSLGQALNPSKGEYISINKLLSNSSFNLVTQGQLLGMEKPIPFGPNFEIIIFSVPGIPGLIIMDHSFTKKVFKTYSITLFREENADGLAHPQVKTSCVTEIVSLYFQKAFGLWNNIVWMNQDLKDRIESYIPTQIRKKIATEIQATDVETLLLHLRKTKHPLLAHMVELDSDAIRLEQIAQWNTQLIGLTAQPFKLAALTLTLMSPDGKEYELELENCHVSAEKVRIKQKSK